ncbi:MAG: hypothetical protein KGJ40_05155 [candidate division NC10 bacterium]|nr:hypothetical protein [candidate division NC10 bacterium]
MTQQSGITPKGEATDPEIATLRQDGDSDVTLILKKGKFAEFLFGFLGARETLSKTFDNDFIVRIEDLLQFHYLLEQKIAKEQFIAMSLVTAVIRYDDNTNRTINTFEAIEKYSEHRDIGVQSFDMCWNFVFKTPDMNTMQQQKVSVFFETASVVSPTLLYIWRPWSKCAPPRRSIQILAGSGCDCPDSL